MTAWPALMLKKTAAAYLDMSEGAFEREIFAGRLPAGEKWAGRMRWRKDAIDAAITRQANGEDLPDYRKRLKERYGKAA